MLIEQLELEAYVIINRKIYPVVTPFIKKRKFWASDIDFPLNTLK